jgi:hypothetical protein
MGLDPASVAVRQPDEWQSTWLNATAGMPENGTPQIKRSARRSSDALYPLKMARTLARIRGLLFARLIWGGPGDRPVGWYASLA